MIRSIAIAALVFAAACAPRGDEEAEVEPTPKPVETEPQIDDDLAAGPERAPGAQTPGTQTEYGDEFGAQERGTELEPEVEPDMGHDMGDMEDTEETAALEEAELEEAEMEAAEQQEGEEIAMLDQEEQGEEQPGAETRGDVPVKQPGAKTVGAMTAKEAKRLSRQYPAAAEPERVTGAQEIELPNQTRLVVIQEEPVVLRAKVCVNEQGKPAQVQVIESSGFPKVDAEAKKQIQQWTYEPREVEGEAVAFCEIVSFELQG